MSTYNSASGASPSSAITMEDAHVQEDSPPSVDDPDMEAASPGDLLWLFTSVLLMLAIAAVAAYAPARIKLLGLFAVGFGVVCGLVSAAVAQSTATAITRAKSLLVGLLVAGAFVLVSLSSFRSYRAELKDVAGDRKSAAFKTLTKLQLGKLPEDEQSRQQVEQMREAVDSHLEEQNAKERLKSFQSFLEFRVSPLGDWAFPWPQLFWVAEMLLATVAGAVSFLLVSRRSSDLT